MSSENIRVKVDPDLNFIQDIIDNGGESLKKCFQCGTCSVVCNLSPADHPFPRRQMIRAQWGMQEELMVDPDVWLCHQCQDCTARCPRGAKPGDVLGAVRKKVIEGLAWPSFMGKAAGRPKYWPILFLFPAIILLVVYLIGQALSGHHISSIELINNLFHVGAVLSKEPIVYSTMFTHLWINVIFPTFTALAGLAFLIGLNKMFRGMSGLSLFSFLSSAKIGKLIKAAIEVITRIIAHSDFEECDENDWRKTAHMLVFYAFVGLLITTALAIGVWILADGFDIYAFGHYPLIWYHPIKWLGNGSALALVAGIGIMIRNRKEEEKAGNSKSSPFDLYLLYVFLGVVVTGFLAQIFRFIGLPPIVAYPTYFLHLVLVFGLLVYAPYSKFAHIIYRTVCLIYIKYEQLIAE